MPELKKLTDKEEDLDRFAAVADKFSGSCGKSFRGTCQRLLNRDACEVYLDSHKGHDIILGLLYVRANDRYKVIHAYSSNPDDDEAASLVAKMLKQHMAKTDKGLYAAVNTANHDPQVGTWMAAMVSALKALGVPVSVQGNYYEADPCQLR
jgi:hypothetical protein